MASPKNPVVRELRRRLGGDKVDCSPERTLVYATDVSRERGFPMAVVFAESAQDVIKSVKIAARWGIPISARGAGTGMSGGAVPRTGGIALSFERMKRILSIDRDRRAAVVEPGVITSKLQDEAAKLGLFFPPDPSSYKICTIGGNIGENAGGLRCVKYGVTSDYVLGLEFVTAEGELVSTGWLDDYCSEIDLTQLMCGSEGTLGIIVKAALKLIKAPPSHLTMLAEFGSAVEAGKAVTAILNSGHSPCILEFIDKTTLKAITNFVRLDLSPETCAVLLIEYDEDAELNRELGERAGEICRSFGAHNIKTAEGEEERNSLWKLRRSISPSLTRLASGKINEDVAVPRGKIADLVAFAEKLSAELGLTMPVYGHAGDGNLHVNFIFDRDNPQEAAKAHRGVETILSEVVKMGGTISGEHGIGLTKRGYLSFQLSPESLALQRRLKGLFDPGNLINPGKIFSEESAV